MGPKHILAATLLMLAGCAGLPAEQPRPRVALDTTAGRIVLALDAEAAPISTCNFISYVVFGDYDNGSFFRTVVRETNTANPNPILRKCKGPTLSRSLKELNVELCNQSLLNSLPIRTTLNHPGGLQPATDGSPAAREK